jgi:hypothetical protein
MIPRTIGQTHGLIRLQVLRLLQRECGAEGAPVRGVTRRGCGRQFPGPSLWGRITSWWDAPPAQLLPRMKIFTAWQANEPLGREAHLFSPCLTALGLGGLFLRRRALELLTA